MENCIDKTQNFQITNNECFSTTFVRFGIRYRTNAKWNEFELLFWWPNILSNRFVLFFENVTLTSMKSSLQFTNIWNKLCSLCQCHVCAFCFSGLFFVLDNFTSKLNLSHTACNVCGLSYSIHTTYISNIHINVPMHFYRFNQTLVYFV